VEGEVKSVSKKHLTLLILPFETLHNLEKTIQYNVSHGIFINKTKQQPRLKPILNLTVRGEPLEFPNVRVKSTMMMEPR